MAVFVLGENMVLFRFVLGGILERAFCLECGLC